MLAIRLRQAPQAIQAPQRLVFLGITLQGHTTTLRGQQGLILAQGTRTLQGIILMFQGTRTLQGITRGRTLTLQQLSTF